MGKYTSNITEVILEHVDIEQLISEYVPLKRAGSNIKGLCPFHNEKTASFVVSSDKQVYHCFGCGASGNAIGFIMAMENLDFLDALEHIADRVHLDLEPYLEKQTSGHIKKVTEDKSLKMKYYDISKHSARFYYQQMKKNKKALDYFENRDISDHTIKTFGLGYAPEGWQNIIDYFDKAPFSLSDLEAMGLVIKKEKTDKTYDRFRDRVMFPIIDVQGRVIAFGGRIIGEGQPKYLNSPETLIFSKSNTLYNLNLAKNVLNEDKTLIVVEGYMDVIALYQSGIKNVVATLGTALTSQHASLIRRYANQVIIAYDSDEAGQKATERSVEILEKAKLDVRVLLLTDGLDPDEFLKKYGVDVLKEKLKNAFSYVDYQIHLLRHKYDLNYEEERRNFYFECVPILKALEESAVKKKYIETVSKWSRMSIDEIQKDVFHYKKGTPPPKNIVMPAKKKSKLFVIEARLLYLALLNHRSFDKIFELIDFEDIRDEKIKKILKFLKGYYQVMESFELQTCIDHLSLEEIKFIQLLLDKSIVSENIEREIIVNCTNFELETLSQKIIRTMNKMMILKEDDSMNKETQEKQLKTLQRELVDLKKIQANRIKALGR
jgi:DNA primase